MRRVIDGIAYNTATAERIAVSEREFKWLGEAWRLEAALCRTQTGHWFVSHRIGQRAAWRGAAEWFDLVRDIPAAVEWVQRAEAAVLVGKYFARANTPPSRQTSERVSAA
jgi:hypothetical protein